MLNADTLLSKSAHKSLSVGDSWPDWKSSVSAWSDPTSSLRWVLEATNVPPPLLPLSLLGSTADGAHLLNQRAGVDD